jgi:DNA-binding NarL/FixJ family response regulator
MHNEKIYIERMYSAGIHGYLLKSAGKEEIIQAIEKVSNGEKYFSSEVTAAILDQKTNSSTSITSSELTKREREILSHIASGLTNPEIADKLFLSPATIKTHRKNIMRKLDVNNTASLVKYALEHSSTLK